MSVLSTASVKYACLYRKYFSFSLGGDPSEGESKSLPGGCDHVAFLSALELVNEKCRVTDSGKKTPKQNDLQHLNVHVHRAVHEMLAYCVTSSLLQFDNDEFSFLMTNIYEYIHYIQSLKSIWTKRMSTWGCYFCCVCGFFFFLFFQFWFIIAM